MRRALLDAREERGTAMVEFALVLPVVLLLIFGILWFGRAFNYSTDQTHLANEAARYAAVNSNPGSASNQTLCQWILSQIDTTELKNGGTSDVPTGATIHISFPSGTSNVGDPVQVQLQSQFKFIPILNLAPVTITRTATMRLESIPSAYSTSDAGCS